MLFSCTSVIQKACWTNTVVTKLKNEKSDRGTGKCCFRGRSFSIFIDIWLRHSIYLLRGKFDIASLRYYPSPAKAGDGYRLEGRFDVYSCSQSQGSWVSNSTPWGVTSGVFSTHFLTKSAARTALSYTSRSRRRAPVKTAAKMSPVPWH